MMEIIGLGSFAIEWSSKNNGFSCSICDISPGEFHHSLRAFILRRILTLKLNAMVELGKVCMAAQSLESLDVSTAERPGHGERENGVWSNYHGHRSSEEADWRLDLAETRFSNAWDSGYFYYSLLPGTMTKNTKWSSCEVDSCPVPLAGVVDPLDGAGAVFRLFGVCFRDLLSFVFLLGMLAW